MFSSKCALDDWLSDEDLLASVGYGGGERIAASKKDCRWHCEGETVKEFEETLQLAFKSKKEKIPFCMRPNFKEVDDLENKFNTGYKPKYYCKLSIYYNHISIGITTQSD